MSDTTYVDYVAPTVSAEWLNEINDHVWHDTPVIGSTIHNASAIKNTPNGTIEATNVQAAINEIVSDLSNDSGSSLIGFIQASTGAVTRTAQDEMRDTVSVRQFGAIGGSALLDGPAFQAAINSVPVGKAIVIRVPSAALDYDLTSIALSANGRFPSFVFEGTAGVVPLNAIPQTIPTVRHVANGINFDNTTIRIGSNDAGRGRGVFQIGGADPIENGNGGYIYNDGHPNWNIIQSSIPFNPTEWCIYGNGTGGIAVGNGTTTITRSTGPNWIPAMVGKPFYFGAVGYSVVSFVDASHLVLNVAAPSTTDTWHYVRTTGSGTCSVVGTTVTRTTGEPFVPTFPSTGYTFTLNGVTVTVLSVTNGDTLTLSAAPGNSTNTPYTFELNINEQISTLRVQKLAGADEENLAFWASPNGYNIHSLTAGVGKYRPVFMGSGEVTPGTLAAQIVMQANGDLTLGGTYNNEAIRILNQNGGVNRLETAPAPAGFGPTWRTRGSDANIDMNLDTQGAGTFSFTSHSFGNSEFKIFGVGGSSFLAVQSDNANAPSMSSQGAAANIDLKLTPKGSGLVQLATAFVAGAPAATGYISIKDSTGTIRKVLVGV